MNWLLNLATLLIGGGVFAFVQFLITRHDEKDSKVSEILSAIDKLDKRVGRMEEKENEREAINFRVRILRFGDEMLEGRLHSKDSYDQVLSDGDGYERFCAAHPEFRNNITVETLDNIKRSYRKRLTKGDFLHGGITNEAQQ